MSYDPSSQKITAPVSIYDVQRAIGSSSPDVGTLCKGNVNQWSKYKPIKYAKIGQLTAAEFLAQNFGIKDIPTWVRLSYMATFLFSTSRGSLNTMYWPQCDQDKGSLSEDYWTLDIPTGGTNSPYRLHDFSDYYHLAEKFIGDIVATTINIQATGTLRIEFAKGSVNTYTLKLSEMTWPGSAQEVFGSMYFGVLMQQTSGSLVGTTYVVTAKADGSDVTIASMESQNSKWWAVFSSSIVEAGFVGSWKIFPIISNSPIAETSSTSSQTGKFVALLPFHMQSISINIMWAEVLFTSYHGYKDGTSQQRYARFNFTFRSPETTPGIVRNFTVTVTLRDSNGTALTGYTGLDNGQITTNASGTATATANVSIYIAQIWNTAIYYDAVVVMTDSLKFKRSHSIALTGPIQVESPTPDA